MILKDPGEATLPLTLVKFTGAEQAARLGPLAAASVLATIPSLVFFAVIQRRLRSGLTAGAVKVNQEVPMRHSLRSVVAVAAAAVIGLAAGCSGGGGSDSGKPVKLKFLSLAWQKDSARGQQTAGRRVEQGQPDIQVQYVQGSWDNVNDQLVTSFEGGDPPDVIHDDSSALASFAGQGYLADLTKLIPAGLKNDIPPDSWGTGDLRRPGRRRPGDLRRAVPAGVAGHPRQQEDARPGEGAGPDRREPVDVGPVPARSPRSSRSASAYGTAWAMKAPVNRVLNLALNFGGTFFQTAGGKTTVKVGPQEREVLQRIHDQLYVDKSADPSTLGMSTSDPLPGFYAGQVRHAAREHLHAPAGRRAGAEGLPVGDDPAAEGAVDAGGRHLPDAVRRRRQQAPQGGGRSSSAGSSTGSTRWSWPRATG